jgi:hypothetical protein
VSGRTGRRRLIFWGSLGGAVSLLAITGFVLNESNIHKCNTGETAACLSVAASDFSRITNKAHLLRIEREKQNDLDRLKRQEDEARKREVTRQNLAAAAAKAKADAEAKFKAEGWWETEPGILVRWCDDCSGSETYMDYVWRMEVWCKERACGDIYARINIQRGSDGPIVGWTNETAYGDIGQRVILTFQSSTPGNASLTEFKARGS